MFKAVVKLLSKQHLFETREEKQKFTGLVIVTLLGTIGSFLLVVRNLAGTSSPDSIPGNLALLATFSLALYSVLSGRLKWAVNTVFLLPFVAYFYFISKSLSAFSPHNSLSYSLTILSSGYLFLLLFCDRIRLFHYYFFFSSATILIHLYVIEKTFLLPHLQWGQAPFLNPILINLIAYLATWLPARNFNANLKEWQQKVWQTSEQINSSLKSLRHGVLVMEIRHDEFGTPVNLIVSKTNPAFERMFRTPARMINGKEAGLIFPKIFRNAFDWHDTYFVTRRNSVEFYVDHLDKWIEVYNLTPDNNHIVSLFYDITKKQKTIQELKESKQRFKVLLEAIPDIFFIIDKDGIYVDFVTKETENLRIDAADIIGNSIYEVGFSEKMSRKIYQCIQDCIQFDSIETIEYALEVNGGTAMFEMRIARLSDDSVITIARDITKRKLIEIKLEEAKNKAEEADRLKSAFLANISHEIRTPMNAIIGFSKMIASPEFDLEEKNKFIDIIISNGKLLMELINDMISLSKIESNQVTIKIAPCKINNLLVMMYREYSYDIESKNIRLKLSNENANPKFTITTDQLLLKEVLEKLIDNAIKFTHEGEVEFGYQIESGNRIRFFVKDTGIGIAPEHQHRIFERFHQLDNRTTRDYEGTGLGLSIAQYYVKVLGGELQVESEPGKGSMFYFSIPAEMSGNESALRIVR